MNSLTSFVVKGGVSVLLSNNLLNFELERALCHCILLYYHVSFEYAMLLKFVMIDEHMN